MKIIQKAEKYLYLLQEFKIYDHDNSIEVVSPGNII